MALCSVAVQKGLGVRPADLSIVQIMETSKWVVIVEPFVAGASALGRISFAVYLRTLLSKMLKWQIYSLWAIIVLQAVSTVMIIVADLTVCGTHISAQWNTQYAQENHIRCVSDATPSTYVQGGMMTRPVSFCESSPFML